MTDFQEEALRIAETGLAGIPSDSSLKIQRLYRAFCASFLHYTRKEPGHWRHPRATWSGFPDLPSVGSCICLAILMWRKDPVEMVLRYHEFLGAMASRLSPEDAAYALLSIRAAKKRYPNDPRFCLMEHFLLPKAKKPASKTYVRAERIAKFLELELTAE